jgi:hypothetical protein
MAAIPLNWGHGGIPLVPYGQSSADQPSIATFGRDVADDLTELRTQLIALLAKIDADATDTGGDSDYESTLTPAALATTKA